MDHYRSDPRVKSVVPDAVGSLGFTVVRTDTSFAGVDLHPAYDYLCAADDSDEIARRLNEVLEFKPGLDDLLFEPDQFYPVLRHYRSLGRETAAFLDALRAGEEDPHLAVRQRIIPFAGDLVWFLQYRTPDRFVSAQRGLLAHYGIPPEEAWDNAAKNVDAIQPEIEISKADDSEIYQFTLPGFPGLAPAILDSRLFLDWFIDELKLDGLWLTATTRNAVLACNRADEYDIPSALELCVFAQDVRDEEGFSRSNIMFQYEPGEGAVPAFFLNQEPSEDYHSISPINSRYCYGQMVLEDDRYGR